VTGRAVAVVMAAGLLAAGCGGQTADAWIKARLAPMPTREQVNRIKSDRPDDRREGLLAAASDRNARAEPAVVEVFCRKAVEDEDPMVRSAAVRGLALMDGPQVVPSLELVATRDGSPYVRADAVTALGGKDGGADVIMRVLRGDAVADVRVAAAGALRSFKDKAAAEALLAAMGDGSLAVAQKAWLSLRYMTGQNLPRQARVWEEYLTSPDDLFAAYGKPPPLPKEASQRENLRKGPRDLIRSLFAKDPNEAALE
jgi:hypothetical protein